MQSAPPLKIGFAGSPEFSTRALSALLHSRHNLVAVYTQPDRGVGRGQKLAFNPVKTLALEHNIKVLQPASLKNQAAQDELQSLQLDLLVVVAYGQILPLAALQAPRLGCWNIHASLLPRWRGAAPIQRAIQAGDEQTGVCIMQMDEGLDTGAVLHQLSTEISATETGGSLHDRLAILGSTALLETLNMYDQDKLPTATRQAETGISYAHKLSKAEAQIDWQQPAEVIERSIRAFNPWPVAWAEIAGQRLRIFAARTTSETTDHPIGEIISVSESGIRIACGQGQLEITQLQKPGGKPISAKDYFNSLGRQAGR